MSMGTAVPWERLLGVMWTVYTATDMLDRVFLVRGTKGFAFPEGIIRERRRVGVGREETHGGVPVKGMRDRWGDVSKGRVWFYIADALWDRVEATGQTRRQC
jgi:hypothetical protein